MLSQLKVLNIINIEDKNRLSNLNQLSDLQDLYTNAYDLTKNRLLESIPELKFKDSFGWSSNSDELEY